MTAQDYLGDWYRILDIRELNRIFKILSIEYEKKPVCPEKNEVLRAFNACSYKDVKIVMLGQDPYPQKGVATGLLFGNNIETPERAFSPSLIVLRDSLRTSKFFTESKVFNPTLENWASQGILLLNSSLTVEMNRVGSHSILWRNLLSSLLKKLSTYNPGIIYVLFGKQAQSFKTCINHNCNTILAENHPAWYAREGLNMPPNIFHQIHSLVEKQYGYSINWFQEY